MKRIEVGSAVSEYGRLDDEVGLLADTSLRVELPCTLAQLQGLVAPHGADPASVVFNSSAYVGGRDVLTVRIAAPEHVALLTSRAPREFVEAASGDDCVSCGEDLAHHLNGITCP